MNTARKWCAALLALAMLAACFPGLAEPPDGTPSASPADGEAPPEMPNSETPPEMPDGEMPPEMPDGEMPPEMPDGEMPPEMPGDGGAAPGGDEDGYVLTGVLTVDSESAVYDGASDGDTLTSETGDENVVLAQNGASLILSNVVLNKTGDSADANATDFYAVNAVVAAKSGSTIELSDAILESAAVGANGLFASGEGSTLCARNVAIHSSSDNSRGLDATYGGTVVADNLTIDTEGAHSAAAATDRGGGSISIANSTLSTVGQGSPLIYSTGTIEAIGVTGESMGAQIAGMEGLNTVRLIRCDLTGSGNTASEPLANGVLLYQSMSGDSSEGTALFEAVDSALTSSIDGGAMFYVTNTSAEIVLENTALNFDSESNALIAVLGNDSNGWGTPGENGGTLKFTAIGEALSGDVVCDGISSAELYLVSGTSWTGAAVRGETYAGDGGIAVNLSAGSTWIVTADSELTSLSMPEGASVVDESGNAVTIVGTDGTVYVEGGGEFTVTVGSFTTNDRTADAGAASDPEIDRSGLEA